MPVCLYSISEEDCRVVTHLTVHYLQYFNLKLQLQTSALINIITITTKTQFNLIAVISITILLSLSLIDHTFGIVIKSQTFFLVFTSFTICDNLYKQKKIHYYHST